MGGGGGGGGLFKCFDIIFPIKCNCGEGGTFILDSSVRRIKALFMKVLTKCMMRKIVNFEKELSTSRENVSGNNKQFPYLLKHESKSNISRNFHQRE